MTSRSLACYLWSTCSSGHFWPLGTCDLSNAKDAAVRAPAAEDNAASRVGPVGYYRMCKLCWRPLQVARAARSRACLHPWPICVFLSCFFSTEICNFFFKKKKLTKALPVFLLDEKKKNKKKTELQTTRVVPCPQLRGFRRGHKRGGYKGPYKNDLDAN